MSSGAKIILSAAISIMVILLSIVLSIKGFITLGQHFSILGLAIVGNFIVCIRLILKSIG